MKKLYCGILILAVLLFSCSNPSAPSTTTTTNPSDISEIAEIQARNVTDSGATTIPTTALDVTAVVGELLDKLTDPVLNDFVGLFQTKAIGLKATETASVMRALNFAKDLNTTLQSQLEKIQTDAENFSTTKNLSGTIAVSGENIGNYFKFTQGAAAFSVSAVTSNGLAIADDIRNLQSVSGSGTATIAIDPNATALAASGSAIKDLKFKLNIGGTGNLSTKVVNNERVPDRLTLDYAESLGFALSVKNSTGTGGKIIVKEDVDFNGYIEAADLGSSDLEGTAELFAPIITITVKVYNDSDVLKFNKTYSSIENFINDFAPTT